MKASYQTGGLVIYKVEYKNQAGVIKGKPRPLIIVSEPNSKGDYLAIAGSTQIHQWLDEEHVLILPDMALEGRLDKPTIFPVSKQLLINPKFIRAQIGRILPQYVERLLRLRFAQHTGTFFRAVHRPKNKAAFIPANPVSPTPGGSMMKKR